MQTLKPDSALPVNRDLLSFYVNESGQSPNKHFVTVFNYADGCQRTFDGHHWTVTKPRFELEDSQL